MLRVEMLFRKSGLVPGFTIIRKYASECDGIVVLHSAHRWKGVARGN